MCLCIMRWCINLCFAALLFCFVILFWSYVSDYYCAKMLHGYSLNRYAILFLLILLCTNFYCHVIYTSYVFYSGDDPNTKAIAIYMETIGDARSFMSAAREVAMTKPIIVIKPGRTEQAAAAAASHTGSLTGRDDVLG